MSESVRLTKRVTEIAACSRSEAEQYISGGWVSVDGEVIESPGHRVQMQQTVSLSPDATLAEQLPVTLLLHKPTGLAIDVQAQSILDMITSASLSTEDRSGTRFLQRHRADLSLPMPLDDMASGLLVLTQDWRIKRKLQDEQARVETECIVEVRGELAEDGLALLNHGLPFHGRPLAPIKVSWQNETRLRFAIKGILPGQIQHMCKMVGLEVLSIKRLRIGRVSMAGLPVGQWRYLAGYERF